MPCAGRWPSICSGELKFLEQCKYSGEVCQEMGGRKDNLLNAFINILNGVNNVALRDW
jgi:hypothetical protein